MKTFGCLLTCFLCLLSLQTFASGFSVIESDSFHTLSRCTLPNGMNLIIDEIPGGKTVYAQISVRTGSVYETEEQSGISHLLEHLLFKEKDNPTYTKILESGGSLNAYTNFDITAYHFQTLVEDFGESWTGLAGMVLEPAFDAHDVEIERSVVLQEVDMGKSDPMMIAYYSVINRLLPDSPFGRPIIGFRKHVKKLSWEDVREYYDKYYTPANMFVVVSGGVDRERVYDLVSGSFAGLDKGDRNPGDYAVPSDPEQKFFRIKTLTNIAYLFMGAKTEGYGYEKIHAFSLLVDILSDGRNSRLYKRFIDEGLTDSIESIDLSIKDIGIVGMGIGVDPVKLERAREIMREEIALLSSEPPSAEELERVKSRWKGKWIFAAESDAGLAGYLVHNELYGLSLSQQDHEKTVESVTAEDIQKVASSCLSEDDLIEVQIVPAKGLGKIKAILKYLMFKRL